MSFDLDILRAFAEPDTYGRFSKYVRKSSLGEETYRIFDAMGEWYKHNHEPIMWSKFGPWFLLVKYPKLDETKASIYRSMFATLSSPATRIEVPLDEVISGLVTRDYAAEIAEAGLKVADGDDPKGMERIGKLYEEWQERNGKLARLEDSIVTSDILSVLESVGKGGFNWRLNCLNDSLGPLRQGDFIVVGTRPDTGKTTLLASESTFIATQDERPVLWLNNEEGGKKVLRRIIQSALGWPTHKMETDTIAAAAEYKKLYGREDKFIVYDNAYISTKDVEALCKKYNPCLIIFDQLWKIKGYDSENEVTRLTMLFNWGREIAKAYAPVITVHQADGTAEGQKWIAMSQLYMSKTGIQGEADAIITMGRTPETGNSRYLYVPKNKMSGTVPHLRNGKFELEIIGDTARFKEPT